MIKLALALAMIAGAAQAADKAADQPDCRLKMIASLEMQTTMDGRVTIPVQIEGHDYRLMVDTGGYINTVSPGLVKHEGYRPSVSTGVRLKGMGTTMLNSYVTVKDFAIGNAHGKDFNFFVDSDNGLFEDGTLAPQIMASYDTDIDFAHDRFTLISPDHCPGQVVYWTKSPFAVVDMTIENRTHIAVPVTIDGKEIDAVLDTGAHTSYINMSMAARLGLDEKDPAMKLRGTIRINGLAGPVYNYPFKSLSFGAVTVSNPRLEIVSDKVWPENKLLLGVGTLRQLHLYIAYKERKLYVTPAQAD
jgi:predicted aspartyl protease